MANAGAAREGLFLGLMSGTSADAIDVVVASFAPQARIHGACSHPWPDELRQLVLALVDGSTSLDWTELGRLDARLGLEFGRAANHLLRTAQIDPARIRAIGSHGQTVHHAPQAEPPFTLQLGNPARIAELTGIDVVADFRQADLAAGGQGAPLLPILHDALLASATETRVVLNLGGIANITVLAPGAGVTGFDTGPANALLDAWAGEHLGQAFDKGGAWAARGTPDEALLERLADDAYFQRAAPKSTGREYFNLGWLQARLTRGVAPVDVQATLLALSARTIVRAIHASAPAAARVIACGGGVHNKALMRALAEQLAPTTLHSSAAYAVDPDWLEAMAFAWLARQRLLGLPGNLPGVTGARGARVLGSLTSAPR